MQSSVKAGIMLAGDGLKPTARASAFGSRRWRQEARSWRDRSPKPKSSWRATGCGRSSRCDEAVEWVRRCPNPMPGEESEIEIRPLYEMEDFVPAAG